MKRTSLFGIALGAFFLLTGLSCRGSAPTSTLGGLFLSVDEGVTWEQRVFVSEEDGKEITLARTDVIDFDAHPTQGDTLYLTVHPGGVYTTKNAGEQWSAVLPTSERITAFAQSAKNPNTFFVILGNKVLRSTDGGAEWRTIFTESAPNVTLQNVLLDSFDARRVYLLRSNSTVTRSLNGGSSWAPMTTLPRAGNISFFTYHPKDTRIMTIVGDRGFFRSQNLGETWENFNEPLEKAGARGRAQAVVFDAQNTARVLYYSESGLYETRDNGVSWGKKDLLTDLQSTPITSAVIDPTDGRKLYYTAAGTLFHSPDNGKSWVTRTLPSTKTPKILTIDPRDGRRFFLGVAR
jgi:photosystem II stability/assembly factor-like uncharacterized protein